jgi:hypothetical protein
VVTAGSMGMRASCQESWLVQRHYRTCVFSSASTPRNTRCISLWYVLCRHAFTRGQALPEESPLHWIARAGERRPKMLARNLVSPAAKLEFAEGCEVERIGGKPIRVSHRANLFEPSLRAFVLGDGDGAVKGNDRGWTYLHQCVVKGNDVPPVCVLDPMRRCVNPCDRGLHMIFGQVGARRRDIK